MYVFELQPIWVAQKAEGLPFPSGKIDSPTFKVGAGV